MADVTISQLNRAFPYGGSIVPFSSGESTFGSAVSSLFIESNLYKTNITIPKTKFVVSSDTVNNTIGIGPSNAIPLASFYVNTLDGNAAVPRGLEIGAPAGSITAPVYLKVSSTSNRFAIFDENNNENFTIRNRNIGINSSSPIGMLQIHDTSQSSGIIYKSFFITFESAPLTKYLKITINNSGAFNLQATMIGVYNYINAGGSYRKNYAIHYNYTTTLLYGYGSSVAFDMGELSKYYAIDDAYKPNNTTIVIPIRRYSSVQGTNVNQLGLSLQMEFAYGIPFIDNIEIVNTI